MTEGLMPPSQARTLAQPELVEQYSAAWWRLRAAESRPRGCQHIDPTGGDRECFCPDAEELDVWLAHQDQP